MEASLALLESQWGPQGTDDKVHQYSELLLDRSLSFQRSLLTIQNKTENSGLLGKRQTRIFLDLDGARERELNFRGLQMGQGSGKASRMGCGDVIAVCGPLSQMACYGVGIELGRL